MKHSRQLLTLLSMLLLLPAGLYAQGTTGTLTGQVTQSGTPLPGVTVTITSPQLQGSRTSVTNENGGYNFPALPPGDYTVKFSLEGMQVQTRRVNVGLVSTARVDADMKVAAVAESITVTASAPAVMETTQVETNYKQTTINRLPVNRNPVATANLAPGVTSNGPAGNTVISGAMSYDNLYLVNGAVVNENLRGQPHQLYIEDAIQETTILNGAVSAEYGRFTGGVVSAITKSGGNDFSGSIRDSLDDPRWTAKSTPTQAKSISHVNDTYEGTLGGRIIRDRLWFFMAGRMADNSQQQTLNAVVPGANVPGYTIKNTRHRFEGKLTGNITNKHSLVLSYLNNNTSSTNNCQFGCLDFRTIDPSVKNPNNFKTAHYSGIITNNFMVEGDYAKKYFAFVGFGGDQPPGATSPADLAAGTPIEDAVVTGAIFNAPYFCGTCGPELRNNHEWEAKARYYVGTKALGSHNLVAGYDDWAEQRRSNNYQSPTNFRFDILNQAPVQNPDNTVSIAIHGSPTTGDRFVYFPILALSQGSDLQTKSVFANDKWDLNQHFSFNLGARYDNNHALDSFGNLVSNDHAISPRLGAIYDVTGSGVVRIDANYSKYVGRLAETVAGSTSPAGNPASIVFRYAGPDIPLQDSRTALAQAFQWFLANGGTSMAPSGNPSIPGFNRKLARELKSPDVREITVGAGTQIGKGYVRADIINRNWENFYVQRTSLDIGQVASPANPNLHSDLILVDNSNTPQRKYNAFQAQGQYQLPAGFGLGANYTYSKLKGNVEGETSGSGPVTFTNLAFQYAQYQNFNQNAPIGYLNEDQRHKVRAWLSSDIGTPVGHFNIGLLERFDSGTPYSASASIQIQKSNSNPNGIVNPGYAQPPTTVTYFFSNRGQYRWQNVTATDLALNYELPIKAATLFAKGEVRNVFNKLAVVGGDSTVYTSANAGKGLSPFNPFTTVAPVECPQGAPASQCTAMGANWQKGPNFGKPLSPTTFTQNGSYQLPRTYLASFGVRF